MRRSLVLALGACALPAAVPGSAAARPAVSLGFQVNVAATSRTWEDTSVIQFSITPATRAKVRLHGHTRRAGVSAFTLTNDGGTASTLRYAHEIGVGAFVDRSLTAAQRKHWHSRLVWIDGDVLAVNPANPLCAQGTTLTAIRSLLRAPASSPVYVPAGLAGDPEALFGLHKPKGRQTPYGRGVATVNEQSAIAAVASDPPAVAAVAFSGARAALAAGAVCAVPVAGVSPTDATLRDGSYPATVRVSYAWQTGKLAAYAQRWYLGYLRSGKVRKLLTTSRGRNRLLP